MFELLKERRSVQRPQQRVLSVRCYLCPGTSTDSHNDSFHSAGHAGRLIEFIEELSARERVSQLSQTHICSIDQQPADTKCIAEEKAKTDQ